MTTKSEAYLRGRREEEARIVVSDIARQVADHLGRDNGRKQRIFQRSPHVFAAMDAEELGTASARELAMRELQEVGFDCGDNDPVAILDALHAGRQFERLGGLPAMDSAGESAGERLIRRMLGE